MKRYGYWVIVGLLCLSTMACDQHSQIAAQNRLVVEAYEKGDYQQGMKLAEKTLHLAEQKLGPEHPATLNSVNNLAELYQDQGRYGEAEPLYQRALAAHEKVLGPEHPSTLGIQLDYTATLVNLKQSKRALQLLQRMESRLLELVALQLRHTRQGAVRRPNFQDVVLTLALGNPEPEYLDLAAKVMLRWKQIQGEEEAFLARLVRRRSEKDAEIRDLAKQIADLWRDLSHLANMPEPDAAPIRDSKVKPVPTAKTGFCTPWKCRI